MTFFPTKRKGFRGPSVREAGVSCQICAGLFDLQPVPDQSLRNVFIFHFRMSFGRLDSIVVVAFVFFCARVASGGEMTDGNRCFSTVGKADMSVLRVCLE
ncbi:hypothetical protein M514_08576 [Trichuris suis]|uniref:Uncharacterized protein n=1 Tax=Trichuris suis TaxID=68888 RepID=A0A085N1X3_9BILA|nr:hypothetical protein M514_08576 [Trichuris suis]